MTLDTQQQMDPAIRRSAETILQWTSYLYKDKIKVSVARGWVTPEAGELWSFIAPQACSFRGRKGAQWRGNLLLDLVKEGW